MGNGMTADQRSAQAQALRAAKIKRYYELGFIDPEFIKTSTGAPTSEWDRRVDSSLEMFDKLKSKGWSDADIYDYIGPENAKMPVKKEKKMPAKREDQNKTSAMNSAFINFMQMQRFM
jgi:hypothetical protein